MRIILASGSKDRKLLLEGTGIKFDVLTSNAEEKSDCTHPGEFAKEISKIKANAVSEKVSDCVIIAADTITCSNGKIFGKPKTREEAIQMILASSGIIQEVWTGVTIIDKYQNKVVSFDELTRVEMQEISKEEAAFYVDHDDEVYLRAGAYAIEGQSSLFTKQIYGDYSNVIGLPISKIYKQLKKLGYTLEDITK